MKKKPILWLLLLFVLFGSTVTSVSATNRTQDEAINWVKSNWVFGIYSHYTVGRMFNAHPKVYVTYRGGNNRLHSNYYANRSAGRSGVNITKVINVNTHKPMAGISKNTTTMNNRRTGTINSAPTREMNSRSVAVNKTNSRQTNSRSGMNPNGNFGGRRK